MSFIQAFLEQSVYLGMPDDSVRNTVVPVAKAKHPVFLFFPRLFLWYARVEKLIWQYSRVENRCVGGVDIKRLNEFRCWREEGN